MKIASNIEQYFDDEGRPLVNGRVTFYDHDSDIRANIFYLEGDTYTAAPNPLTTADDGRVPTVFFEASVKDVKVEKLLADGSYELIDTFQVGFDVPAAKNSTFVYKMESLGTVDPEVGIVTVCGYYTETDCPCRNYVWDPDCTLAPDGGVVVASELGVEGRWVLFYDDEKLPSSFYGVFAGENEANLSAFVNYPDYVGSYQIRTPKIPRFLGGTYQTAGAIVSTKTIYFDRDATFPNAQIQCHSAIVPENSGYVADFWFNGKNTTAHSSWFPTIEGFLNCNADTYIVDKTNYWVNTQLKYPRTLANKTIIYTVNQRLPITYVNNGKITLSKTNIVGSQIFDSTDRLAFSYTEIKDDWWNDPTAVDWFTTVMARSTSLNVLLLANFKNVQCYINAIRANGETRLDLAGRYIQTLNVTAFNDVRNVFCDTMNVSMAGQDVWLHNVKTATSLHVSCRYITCDSQCEVTFDAEPSVSAGWFEDSKIYSSASWYNKTQYQFDRCLVGVTFRRVTDNESTEDLLVFTDCQFQPNCLIESKMLEMYRCITTNNTIKVYPYFDTENNFYRMRVYLENNMFNNNVPIEFTRVETDEHGVHHEECYDIRPTWHIVGNFFTGNDEGLKCRYWQMRLGQSPSRLFIHRGDTTNSLIEYSGNSGKCPADNAKGIVCSDQLATDWRVEARYDEDDNATYFSFYLNGPGMRVMQDVRSAGFGFSLFYFATRSVRDNEYGIKTYFGDDNRIERASVWLYPKATQDGLTDGDFFRVMPCLFGKVEQADPGHVHTWRNLP